MHTIVRATIASPVSSHEHGLSRRLLAEFLGSAFLAALVIGSGIAAQQLSPNDTGLALLENAVATAAGLFRDHLMFGPISGAHFNPVISLVDAYFGGLSWRDALAYIPAQIAGASPARSPPTPCSRSAAISISTQHRASGAHLFAEVVATLGFVLVIFSLALTGRASTAPASVGAYIGAAYWFTAPQLCQPGDQHRAYVLGHVRRNRARARCRRSHWRNSPGERSRLPCSRCPTSCRRRHDAVMPHNATGTSVRAAR